MNKDKTMNKRILVTYATRAGSTVEVASAIGETLSKRGFSVDVKPAKENPSLDGYQAVIVGSAIRMGSWLPEAVDFIKNNQQELNNMPVALFTVHILNLGDDEQSRTNRLAYLNSVHSLIQPVDEIFFTGEIDTEKLSFVDRLMVKMVNSPVGDLRDWDKIHNWSQIIFA
jgi:menaquinone-dependent protoporphyrinogen oxidase